MIYLSEERDRSLMEQLPVATVDFLRITGVPEVVLFRGIEHLFTLDMQLLLAGGACRLGSVDESRQIMAVQCATGYFGYVTHGEQSWEFCNTSVRQFLECHAASEHLWHLEQTNQIAWNERAAFLEREILRLDPVVFAEENNIWSLLVEELRSGVI